MENGGGEYPWQTVLSGRAEWLRGRNWVSLLVLTLILLGNSRVFADVGGADQSGRVSELVVKVNGVPIQWDAGHYPRLYGGRTLVPLFRVVEATGDKVTWYDSFLNGYEGLAVVERNLQRNPLPSGSVIPAHSSQYLRVKLWPRAAEHGGRPDRMLMEWTTPSEVTTRPLTRSQWIATDIRLINGRTYVSVRLLMEALGYHVQWEPWSNSVNIDTKTVQRSSESDLQQALAFPLRNLMAPDSGRAAFVFDHSRPLASTPASMFHLTRLLDQANSIARYSMDNTRTAVVVESEQTIYVVDKRSGRKLHEIHWTHGVRRMTAQEAEHFLAELQDEADQVTYFTMLLGLVIGGAIDTKGDRILEILKNAGGATAGYFGGRLIQSTKSDIDVCYKAAKAARSSSDPTEPIIAVAWVGNSMSKCFEHGHPEPVTLEELMEDAPSYYPGN